MSESILVVDDNPINLKLLKSLLDSKGCDDYVAKPINTRTLPELVSRWL